MTPQAGVPAPLDPSTLADALAPFGRSTMLPSAAYTSADVLAWEQRSLFAGSWVCLGDGDVVATGVTARGSTVGGVPVLLVRTDAGLAAFANTCRHRGHELLPDEGVSDRQAVVCPYHAWSYGLDGSLLAAPGMDAVESFGPAGSGLVRLPLETWHGWVFVNAGGGAPPLDEHLGAIADLLAPYAPERLTRLARHEYVVAANWKVITENYHECYHCALIHPELCRVSPPDSGANFDLPGAWVGGRMDLVEGAVTMSLDGSSRGSVLDGADPRHVLYLGLLPNLLLSLHPGYVMTHRLEPLAPDRTRVECSWYFADPRTDPAYAVDFWDLTNRQDWAACESVQRGLASPHHRPGPLAPDEDAVHRFVSIVARSYVAGRLQPAEHAGPA